MKFRIKDWIIFILATERSAFLEEFLQRLLEPPIGQHFHSVSINKNQLIERYEETVRDLIHRYQLFHTHRNEQQSLIRSNRTLSLITPVQIPVVMHQQPRTIHRIDPRSSSPMQQGDEEPQSLPPPSSSS
jgi:hypothetical protein